VQARGRLSKGFSGNRGATVITVEDIHLGEDSTRYTAKYNI
jgi:hypothetical protein